MLVKMLNFYICALSFNLISYVEDEGNKSNNKVENVNKDKNIDPLSVLSEEVRNKVEKEGLENYMSRIIGERDRKNEKLSEYNDIQEELKQEQEKRTELEKSINFMKDDIFKERKNQLMEKNGLDGLLSEAVKGSTIKEVQESIKVLKEKYGDELSFLKKRTLQTQKIDQINVQRKDLKIPDFINIRQ